MRLSDFDFDLPNELIAQLPADKRDHSNLLLPLSDNSYKIDKFYNLTSYLKPGDLLVFNDSKVINAKIDLGRVSINLNKSIDGNNKWSCFAKPAKKLSPGDEFSFGEDKIIITNKLEAGEFEIEFIIKSGTLFDFLDKYGELPLPPYIKRGSGTSEDDLARYQTVYSKPQGSVAAPTAGLHFTDELLKQIKDNSIDTAFVTLHVGGGTFLPVKTDNILDHKMHSEYCQVSPDVADKINKAKSEKRRIIVVGTTAMRTLESCAENGIIIPQTKETNIFITPGYHFQIADCLITNFHLPKSTLFMLICAFAGMEKMKQMYQYAIDHKMRFFSYGDAMMIERER